MARNGARSETAIDKTIQKNLPQLRKRGVLTVRPGYEIAGHQLTGKAAIVATVHTKKAKADLAPGEPLPDSIGGMPVDVREASAHQRLRAQDPAAAAVTQAYARPEDREPVWPLEREMPSGKLLSSPESDTQTTLKRQRSQQPATDRALTAHETKPEMNYTPPPNVPLETVTLTTTITASASPDAGFGMLQSYLKDTRTSLVIGMYDFTSGPILSAFLADLAAPKTLQMVLDNPAPNPTRNQTDWQTVAELQANLGSRAKIARALVRSDAFAAKWIFPYAYHIKVIVRDNSALWLSSGNLNNSNEPDPASPPHTEDRDWHVIIENGDLAQTFAAYLNHDYQVAAAAQAPAPDDIERTIEDAQAKRAAEANPPPPRKLPAAKPSKPAAAPVAAKTFANVNLTITPLLTPDTLPGGTQGQYLSNIMALVQGAERSLYIQLQYIESSSGKGDPYDALLKAIAARAAAGVDVRLIESADYGEKWMEKMKSTGVDLTANIRLQPSVHNKGFVVDGRTVVVSSQNFSPAGVENNRDAGVIIESPQIAQYFGPIFESDWETRSRPAEAKAPAQKRRAAATKTARRGAKSKAAPKRAKRAPLRAKKRGRR
jgi:hypothetical protein